MLLQMKHLKMLLQTSNEPIQSSHPARVTKTSRWMYEGIYTISVKHKVEK